MSPSEEMEENTIEALREVLQDMTTTIELISSGARSGEALISFLEEMLKTIEAWAAKYNVLLDEKTMGMEPTENPNSNLNPDTNPNPSPNPNSDRDLNPYPNSYVTPNPRSNPEVNADASQVMDQLELALDLDQDVNVNVNELLDLANQRLEENQREGEALPQSALEGVTSNEGKGGELSSQAQNEKAQVQLGEEMQGPSPQTKQGISETASQPSQLPMAEPSKEDVRTIRSQDPVLDAVPIVAAGAAPSNPHVDHTPMDVDMASTNGADAEMISPDHVQKSLAVEVATPVNDKVVVSQASERRGEVIESPDWLPEGWITEMKTRGTGSSAGSKDKYYFDPASKRRFRSKREVFAFLDSGKRDRSKGRSKGRPKTEPLRKLLGTEDQSPGQANDADQSKSTRETSSMVGSSNLDQQIAPNPPPINNTSGPSVPTIAASTGLVSSSMFMPHQPGQPSEWLVYESLASLPIPMFEHLRFVENNANKANTNNVPLAPWPWLFHNSEGLKRPFVDNKSDDSKPVEKSKEGQNVLVSSAGQTGAAEGVPKRPKKVARKNAS